MTKNVKDKQKNFQNPIDSKKLFECILRLVSCVYHAAIDKHFGTVLMKDPVLITYQSVL